MKRFLAFDLDHYSVIDHQVCAKAAFQLDALIHQRDRFLALHMESELLKLVC
jgi:hypothetical protein